MTARNAPLARNQERFRRANERLRERVAVIVRDDQKIPFLCECSDESCTEPIHVTLDEYGRIHDSDSRYLIVPGHEATELETVVEEHAAYAVVDKAGV